MANCGAKCRNGQPCKAKAMAKGRCRMHGGKSTGAPKGNKYTVKAGNIYSKYLDDEDKAFIESVEIGKVDQELAIARLQLSRAMRERATANAKPELESASQTETSGGNSPPAASTTKVMRRKDYDGIIDRCLARIASLELTRATLAKENDDDGDHVEPTSVVFNVRPASEPVRITLGEERKK